MIRAVVLMQKGGTAKTTVAVHAAVGLARRGLRVLLIDLDPQANATTTLVPDHESVGVFGVLVEGADPTEALVAVEDRLSVLPGSRNLSAAEEWLSRQLRREEVLRRRLASLDGRFDAVILDTAPSFSLLNLNASTYASEAWLAVQPEYLAFAAIEQLEETLGTIRRELSHELPVRHVIVSRFDGRRLSDKAIVDALRDRFGDRVAEPIRLSVRVSEAPSWNQSVFDFAPGSPGAADLQAMVERIAGGIHGKEEEESERPESHEPHEDTEETLEAEE